jgi:hypothetical protein
VNLLRHRLRGPADEGSILLALFALMVVTGLLTVGLATIVNAHVLARHDTAFEAALAGAEKGMDELIAQVKASPTSSSFTPVNGTAGGVTYQASATPSGSTWLIDAAGTSTVQGRTVTRHIQSTVSISPLLDVPLFGETSVDLGSPSAIDRYDSATSSDVCASTGNQTTMLTSNPQMCHPVTPQYGDLATDGTLTLDSADLPKIGAADIDNAPAAGSTDPTATDPTATGRCGGDPGVCAAVGGQVHVNRERLEYPLSGLCANGIGGGATAFDGSTVLAANTVYSFSDVTLNANAIADLGNVTNSRIVICFDGTLTMPPLVPLNSTPAPGHPLTLDPRPPASLLLISTDKDGPGPVVNFGAGLPGETAVSAVVYAPNARCNSTGHVDVYGVLICKSVTAPGGLDVHYDVQVGTFGDSTFDRSVTVSHWHEIT